MRLESQLHRLWLGSEAPDEVVWRESRGPDRTAFTRMQEMGTTAFARKQAEQLRYLLGT